MSSEAILSPPKPTNKKKKRKSQASASNEEVSSFLNSSAPSSQDYGNPFLNTFGEISPKQTKKDQQPKDMFSISNIPDNSNTKKQESPTDDSSKSSSESDDDDVGLQLARKYATKKIKKIDTKIWKYRNKIKILEEKKILYLTQLDPNYKPKQGEDGNTEPNGSNDETVIKNIDAIEYMKKGSSMLKYGRYGYPHFRHFELSEDCRSLTWFSSSKNIDKSRIELASASHLQKGQLTQTFRRHLQPKLSPCSFSILYIQNNTPKTLDVIAKTKNDYLIWTKGLTKLLEQKNDLKIEFPNKIMVTIRVKSQVFIEKRLSLQPNPPKKVVQGQLKLTTKRFKKLVNIANDPKYADVVEMNSVKSRLVELEDEMEKMRNLFNTKSLNVASHQIWRTAVDTKALDTKVHAILKTYKK